MENVNAAFEKEVEALIGMLTCTHCWIIRETNVNKRIGVYLQ
jgi:hypothetical protein